MVLRYLLPQRHRENTEVAQRNQIQTPPNCRLDGNHLTRQGIVVTAMFLRLSLLLFLLTATTYSQPTYYPGPPASPPPDVTIAVSQDEQNVAIARSRGGSRTSCAPVA